MATNQLPCIPEKDPRALSLLLDHGEFREVEPRQQMLAHWYRRIAILQQY